MNSLLAMELHLLTISEEDLGMWGGIHPYVNYVKTGF